MSANEDFVAVETPEQLLVADGDNLEDIYVIDVDTKQIEYQSDAHGSKPTINQLSGVDDLGQSIFFTPHGIDHGYFSGAPENPTADTNLLKFDHQLGLPKAATSINFQGPGDFWRRNNG